MDQPVPSTRRRTLRRGADFVEAGLVPAERAAEIERVAARYSVAVTPTVEGLIDPADPADPIARQFVPDAAELEDSTADRPDPIGDLTHSPVKGIVHRYPDRALLLPLLTCPVYCRFCFRRERVGHQDGLGKEELQAAFDYIRAHPELWEIILTGGDPLMLPSARIAALLAELGRIEHVRVVRIHSRVPVVDPGRISSEMLAALSTDKALWIAIHANHADEFGPEARAACARLVAAGIPLLGQSVLLKGVNDDPVVLEALMRRMVECRIKPYYLHHPDLAPGTAHFRLPIERGQELVAGLRGRVSGLCQPGYVLDIPGGHGKAPLSPSNYDDGSVTDWRGRRHAYPPE